MELTHLSWARRVNQDVQDHFFELPDGSVISVPVNGIEMAQLWHSGPIRYGPQGRKTAGQKARRRRQRVVQLARRKAVDYLRQQGSFGEPK